MKSLIHATSFSKALRTPVGLFLTVFGLSGPFLAQADEGNRAELIDFDMPALASRRDVTPILGELRSKARAAKSIPVIIGLRMKHDADVTMATPAQTAQRARISQLQEALLDRLTAEGHYNVKRFRYSPHMAVTVTPEALERLIESEQVTSIEEDVAVPPALAQSGPLINANRAWQSGFDGTGWTVAILDTGVQSDHPFLTGKVVHEACFSTADPANDRQSLCPNGASQQIGPGAAAPCTGDCEHGSHVAGIAAGSGSSFSGIAKGASIIAIQVFSRYTSSDQCSPNPAPCLRSYTSDQQLALEHLYSIRSQYQIAAANMSLGGGREFSYCDTWPLRPVIDNLRAAGIATVVSSGNESYTDSIGHPACVSSAVSVGATFDTAGENNSCNGADGGTSNVDEVACFSNSSSLLDLLAPGVWINSSVPGGGFVEMGGTSMAAPHVSGCWAILRQSQPAASVDQVLQALKDTGVGVTDWRNGITKPRIDCKAALDRLSDSVGANAPDLQVGSMSVTPTSVSFGAQVDLSAVVRNSGSVASTSTTLRYFRSTDATISTADTQLCSLSVPALSPGVSASSQRCVTHAPSTAGTYYFGACVDAASGETYTTNNCSMGQAVTVSATGQADLAASAVGGGTAATVGGLISVSATVANRGTSAAGASRVNFYLAANATVSSRDPYLGFCTVPSLSAGTVFTGCSGALAVPGTVTPGTYRVGVIVDADDQVSESNESNNSATASQLTTITNTQPNASLAEAVDNTTLSFATGGNAACFLQTATSFAGGDAAQSGSIGNDQMSYMQTTVTGPGTLTFRWKVSSERDYDVLSVLLDNAVVDYISGEVDWTGGSVSIPAGSHTVHWAYAKDYSISVGRDAAWVDQVTFTPGSGYSLTVNRSGTGFGSVVSSPAGIDCGTSCAASYSPGTSVTLTPAPATGYFFAGWSGACTGLGSCVVAMDASRSVTAAFSRADDNFPPLAGFPAGWDTHPAGSDAPWIISNGDANGGLYSLRSGTVGDNQSSTISFTGEFKDGYVSFAMKVSSEYGYDGAGFFIDDALQDVVTGDYDWRTVTYPITAGTHTLTWLYVKDGSLSSGQDTAWIDSVSMPLVAAGTGVLGTPVDGSTVSGVGVISGYHCSSKDIEVFIDGVSLGKAGAGTTLQGTRGVCGRTDTGYSLLYAFNNLVNGPHVISVTADGVPFDSHTVTTFRSGGQPWLSGITRTISVPDFPAAGRTAQLQWMESYQNFLITDITGGATTTAASLGSLGPQAGIVAAAPSTGVLGTPVDGSTVSGVGVISGYHCTSKDIEVFVDGVSLGKAGAGTTLLGTRDVCGRTDTGYSLLYAFNNLANGAHVITVKADGVQFDSHTVTTFQSGGQPWLAGVSRSVALPGFPATGKTATLQWMESYQNFLITGISSQ